MKLPFKRRADDRRGGGRTNAGRKPTVIVWQIGDRLRIVTAHGTVDVTVQHVTYNGAIAVDEENNVVAIGLLSEPRTWGVYRKRVKRTALERGTMRDDSSAPG